MTFSDLFYQLWDKGLIQLGVWETIYMTLISTGVAYLLGLPLGVLLRVTARDGIHPVGWLNSLIGVFVNIFRSIPFMILMLFLTPFTRAVMGTSIGASAANLPLTVAAAPFVARMVEQSLEEVDGGVIEAARCMGATNWQIITRVLLVESVPSLLRGLTISTITVFGYTAITGATGAGGLGNIAFRFGYQRYQQSVMYASLLLVIVVVCLIQTVFGHLASKADKRNR